MNDYKDMLECILYTYYAGNGEYFEQVVDLGVPIDKIADEIYNLGGVNFKRLKQVHSGQYALRSHNCTIRIYPTYNSIVLKMEIGNKGDRKFKLSDIIHRLRIRSNYSIANLGDTFDLMEVEDTGDIGPFETARFSMSSGIVVTITIVSLYHAYLDLPDVVQVELPRR